MILNAIFADIASVDLGIPEFSQPICHVLSGNISLLSKQKFSSNVIEKVSHHDGFETDWVVNNISAFELLSQRIYAS